MRSALVAVVLAALLLTSRAQTFVVDQGNGPGTNFTSLAAAAASVPDGAVLLVRPGSYGGFTIAQKGLVVLADPGVQVAGTIAVSRTAPHQGFVLRGVSWSLPPGGGLRLFSCAGPVVLEALTNTAWPASWPIEPYPLDAVACSQLVLRESNLSGYVNLDGVVGAIERCTLTGTSGSGLITPSMTTHGLSVLASELQVIGSTVRGGNGFGSGPFASLAASEGIRILNNTSLRLVASNVIGGTDGGGQRYALSGLTSTARIDTLSSLQGGLQPGGITAQFLPMPRLTALGAAPGGTLQATVATQNGDLVVLAVGLPGAPTSLPGFQDAFWLDPAMHVFHAIGLHQAGAPVHGAVPVPNWPGLRGRHLVWHAACFGPATQQQNTGPGVGLIR